MFHILFVTLRIRDKLLYPITLFSFNILANETLKLDSRFKISNEKAAASRPGVSGFPTPRTGRRDPRGPPRPPPAPNKGGHPRTLSPRPAPHTHTHSLSPRSAGCPRTPLRTHLPWADESSERGGCGEAAAAAASGDGRTAASPPRGGSARRGRPARQGHRGRAARAASARPHSRRVNRARAPRSLLGCPGVPPPPQGPSATPTRSPPLRLRRSAGRSHSNRQRPASFGPTNGRRGGRGDPPQGAGHCASARAGSAGGRLWRSAASRPALDHQIEVAFSVISFPDTKG